MPTHFLVTSADMLPKKQRAQLNAAKTRKRYSVNGLTKTCKSYARTVNITDFAPRFRVELA